MSIPRSELLEALLMMRVVRVTGRHPQAAAGGGREEAGRRFDRGRDARGGPEGREPRPRDAASEGGGRHWAGQVCVCVGAEGGGGVAWVVGTASKKCGR